MPLYFLNPWVIPEVGPEVGPGVEAEAEQKVSIENSYSYKNVIRPLFDLSISLIYKS